MREQFNDTPELEFHWICCRASSLNRTAFGGSIGMDARELLYRNEYVLYDRLGRRKVEIGRRRIE